MTTEELGAALKVGVRTIYSVSVWCGGPTENHFDPEIEEEVKT